LATLSLPDALPILLLPAATPEFKRELRRMIPWWERQLAQLDTVELHLGTRLGPDDQRLADADTVIVAAGSTPVRPDEITGLDREEVAPSMRARRSARAWSCAEEGCPGQMRPSSWLKPVIRSRWSR